MEDVLLIKFLAIFRSGSLMECYFLLTFYGIKCPKDATWDATSDVCKSCGFIIVCNILFM